MRKYKVLTKDGKSLGVFDGTRFTRMINIRKPRLEVVELFRSESDPYRYGVNIHVGDKLFLARFFDKETANKFKQQSIQ